jgi:hypothetical protein
MRKDRNCGGAAMPIPYGSMPMPGNMPMNNGMPMMITQPGMMHGTTAQTPNMSYHTAYNNVETQMNNMQQQINMLEERVNKLEGKTMPNNSNKYSDSNYYML